MSNLVRTSISTANPVLRDANSFAEDIWRKVTQAESVQELSNAGDNYTALRCARSLWHAAAEQPEVQG